MKKIIIGTIILLVLVIGIGLWYFQLKASPGKLTNDNKAVITNDGEYNTKIVELIHNYESAVILISAIHTADRTIVPYEKWHGWLIENEQQWKDVEKIIKELDTYTPKAEKHRIPFYVYAQSAREMFEVKPMPIEGSDSSQKYTPEGLVRYTMNTTPPSEVINKMKERFGIDSKTAQELIDKYKIIDEKSYKDNAAAKEILSGAGSFVSFAVIDVGGFVMTGGTAYVAKKLTTKLAYYGLTLIQGADIVTTVGKTTGLISSKNKTVALTADQIQNADFITTMVQTVVEGKQGKYDWKNYVDIYKGLNAYIENKKSPDNVLSLSATENTLSKSNQTAEDYYQKININEILKNTFPKGAFVIDGKTIITDPDLLKAITPTGTYKATIDMTSGGLSSTFNATLVVNEDGTTNAKITSNVPKQTYKYPLGYTATVSSKGSGDLKGTYNKETSSTTLTGKHNSSVNISVAGSAQSSTFISEVTATCNLIASNVFRCSAKIRLGQFDYDFSADLVKTTP